jgi:hypothetical protein
MFVLRSKTYGLASITNWEATYGRGGEANGQWRRRRLKKQHPDDDEGGAAGNG